MRLRLLSALGLAACAVLLAAGCVGGGGKPRPDLIFVSSRSGVYDIYAMNADGSRQTRLTQGKTGSATNAVPFYAYGPSWSRDGKKIAFWSTRLGKPHVFIMDADGNNAHPLDPSGPVSAYPSWSPDEKRLALVVGNSSQLEIVNADGTGLHRVTNAPLQIVQESNPAWSPDGRWIAYTRVAQGQPIKEIWLVHPDGSANHPLTNLQASTDNAAWSPDSKRLAFSSNVKSGQYGIYTVPVKGGLPTIVSLTTIDEIDPSWSPDGKRLAYSRDGSIVTVDTDGSNEKVLTSSKDNDSSPEWNPIPAPPKKGGSS